MTVALTDGATTELEMDIRRRERAVEARPTAPGTMEGARSEALRNGAQIEENARHGPSCMSAAGKSIAPMHQVQTRQLMSKVQTKRFGERLSSMAFHVRMGGRRGERRSTSPARMVRLWAVLATAAVSASEAQIVSIRMRQSPTWRNFRKLRSSARGTMLQRGCEACQAGSRQISKERSTLTLGTRSEQRAHDLGVHRRSVLLRSGTLRCDVLLVPARPREKWSLRKPCWPGWASFPRGPPSVQLALLEVGEALEETAHD